MPIAWTELFESFLPATGGEWTDYDIFTDRGVPKGAIVEIVCTSGNDNDPKTVGVRTDGSDLERKITLHEAEGGGRTTVAMLVTVDVDTGLIEYYSTHSGAEYRFYITGYWTGVTFTEMATIVSYEGLPVPVWQEKDVFTDNSVPKGSVIQVHCYHQNSGVAVNCGTRADDSVLERYIGVHEAEPSDTNGYTTYVKSDESTGKIELYSDASKDNYYLLLGYFDSDMDYQELWTTYNPDGDGAWNEEDVSASLDEDGRVTNWVLVHDDTLSETNMGVRIAGGDDFDRYIQEHEAETNGQTGFGITVQTSNAGVVDVYGQDVSECDFYLAGYFFPAGAAGWTKLQYYDDLPTGGQFNKLKYATEPPVSSAWNKVLYVGE